jgi:hypothetical protein
MESYPARNSGKTKPPLADPAKTTPSFAAARVSAASDACVRTTSSPVPSASRSTSAVTVTGKAILPSRPSAAMSFSAGLVDEVDPLRARVEDDAEISGDGADEACGAVE